MEKSPRELREQKFWKIMLEPKVDKLLDLFNQEIEAAEKKGFNEGIEEALNLIKTEDIIEKPHEDLYAQFDLGRSRALSEIRDLLNKLKK